MLAVSGGTRATLCFPAAIDRAGRAADGAAGRAEDR